MAEKACYAILSNNAGVTDLAGSRIYLADVSQQNGNNWPVVVFRLVGTPFRTQSLSGYSGLCQRRVRVEIVGDDYPEVRELFDAAVLALEAFRGTAGDEVIQGSEVAEGDHESEPLLQGSDDRLHRLQFDWLAWHQDEPVAVRDL